MEYRTLSQQVEDNEFDAQCERRLQEAVDSAVEYEREECAKVAEDIIKNIKSEGPRGSSMTFIGERIASFIRARA